jgi:hypothetical protein
MSATHESESAAVGSDDVALYIAQRDRLSAALRQHGSQHFEPRTCPPHSGLTNQGATCYLVRAHIANSLLV